MPEFVVTYPDELALKFKYRLRTSIVALEDGAKAHNVWARKLDAAINAVKVVVRNHAVRDAAAVVHDAAQAWDKDIAARMMPSAVTLSGSGDAGYCRLRRPAEK